VDDVMARLGEFTRFTRSFNSIGLPALSVPCGFTVDGLPLGMEIVR
jgi:aspartyl-tRNA(Asn)/glutamyl-tRNA(Gln) amidotransferase subunit A